MLTILQSSSNCRAYLAHINKHSFIQKSFFLSSHLSTFYNYIDTYVGLCAPFVFPNEESWRVYSLFQLCIGGAVCTNSHHTRLHSQRSTPRRGPDSTPDAQLLPSSYRPGTRFLRIHLTHLQLHFQASFFTACSVILSLYQHSLLYPVLFLFVNDFMTCNLSHLPSYYQQPVAYPTRASEPFTPLRNDSHRETQEGPIHHQGDTSSISLPLSP